MGKHKFANNKCHCGSGLKYKKCHLNEDIRLEKDGKKAYLSQKPFIIMKDQI